MKWIPINQAPKDRPFAVCAPGKFVMAEIFAWCDDCREFHGVITKTPLHKIEAAHPNNLMLCFPIDVPEPSVARAMVN